MNAVLLPPYEAGRQARAEGLVREPPAYGSPSSKIAWARGYDDEQLRIETAAMWARSRLPEQLDPWDFM